MITTGSNTISLGVQRRLNDVSRGLNTSFERLSSGLRINRAADDAAGLAIADSLNADSRVYGQAVRNINDGVSALSIADGSLGQLSNIVIRQKELAEQAANGVYSSSQRRAMHTEANALVNEFNRIVGSTSFNGQNLLDGSYLNVSLQAGYGVDGGLRMGIGDDLQRAIGDGTFTVSKTLATGMFPTYINSADFNGDGNADLLTSNGVTLELSYGNGDGTFLAVRSVPHGLPSGSAQQIIGDFNGDGRPDIFSISYNTQMVNSVLINQGDGTFSAANTNIAIPGTWNILSVAVIGSGDFNGDGFDDVAISQNAATGETAIYLSNGNGTFQAPIIRSTGASTTMGVIADFNSDGFDDIMTNNFSGGSSFSFIYGQASGVSAANTVAAGTLIGANSPVDIAVGDFNRDGIADLIITNSVLDSYVLTGNGNGTFSIRGSFSTPGGTLASEVADINGDGYLDLIMTKTGTGTSLTVLGNGDGTFRAPITINSSLIVTNGRNVIAADFNNDGAADLFTSNNPLMYSNVSLSNTTDTSYVGYLNLMSQTDARNTLTQLDQTLRRINLERGRVGSLQSRFEFASSVIQTSRTNYIGAASQIRDVDVAEESAQLVRKQILQGAATAVLVQANQQPALALKLLGGI